MIELNPLVELIILNFSLGLMVAISLNIEVGFLRIPQFGRLLAVIAGAIVAAAIPGRILALYLGMPAGIEYANHMYNFRIVFEINRFLSKNPLLSITLFLSTMVMAAIVGGVIGYLCAYPALRLKGAYLGITLLTFGEIITSIAWNYQPLVGGTTGVFVVNPFGFVGRGSSSLAVISILVISIVSYVYAELLIRSPFGRMLKAIRDSEVAAEVYGKNAVKARAETLVIGGAMAAVAGALWAIYTGSMKASTYTRLTWTFWPWAFMMLGGVGNNLGVLVGVLLYTLARTAIIQYKHLLTSVIPISAEWLEYILIGIVIVAVILYKPQGLIPEKPALTLSRKTIEKIKDKIDTSTKNYQQTT
ncbi:MAG: branched-chain amino acid ABC transporter permease [Ignisphaera sp.]|uniref:Branched-chain amino acid ABC transporter permease n=1 Tax=Ignisphaera aggregans TaxID=334771 RepID=A0A7C4JL75_9CREN